MQQLRLRVIGLDTLLDVKRELQKQEQVSKTRIMNLVKMYRSADIKIKWYAFIEECLNFDRPKFERNRWQRFDSVPIPNDNISRY